MRPPRMKNTKDRNGRRESYALDASECQMQIGCSDRDRTDDLLVMSQPRYLCATLRLKVVEYAGIEPA